MKTSELISALIRADRAPVRSAPVLRRLALAAALGTAISVGALGIWLGVQPISPVLEASWFWMKAGYCLTLALAAFVLLVRLARPGAPLGAASWLLAGAAVFALIVMSARQVLSTPADAQGALWFGSTWGVCPWRILTLAAPIYVVLLLGLRRLAPTRLAATGAAAGLLAGGLAGVVYGLYCREFAAPFVAVWYSAGLALSASVGAMVGARLLRW